MKIPITVLVASLASAVYANTCRCTDAAGGSLPANTQKTCNDYRGSRLNDRQDNCFSAPGKYFPLEDWQKTCQKFGAPTGACL
ncbi:hypothetical protein Tdes44962_MAKER03319 [Teratosphaeria destructans]|uniref:Secreted protein n=1 Tax=Teratosphaeria destructans TaxID=418781 RepID=A0A9W7SQC0_9PEZI|nr:hypothetical protein Tdes44962_MAKER03319 [Teratosphaeria destructans]